MLTALVLAAASVVVPTCAPRDLSVTTDGADGEFNGMQHAGTYLVVANKGRRTCRIEALPQLTLLDARGRPLPARRNVPPGMHPGPVIVPVTLAPGASARAGIRWISGPVFDHVRTLAATHASLKINGGTIRLPFRATLYTEAGKPAGFDQPLLQLTPPPRRPGAN